MKKLTPEELREKLAELAHSQWSDWMEHLFNKCSNPQIGKVATIPAEFADRWGRQMNTPYNELSELEKDSDRKEADKYLKVLESEITQNNKDLVEKVWAMAYKAVRYPEEYSFDAFEKDLNSLSKEK